ncbi:hypothetical protein EVAR_67852_1 [Eumeta japonica]|uniref:Uncharacterized protein n=1 Tax=Eumeta variegata TaxID=151549 RepID=A0A4C1SHF4_EUMVA|nr:hypothetical protein EVAR_67852_1 [Eumeta japonica]
MCTGPGALCALAATVDEDLQPAEFHAWIYRCDDTTRPGVARQRVISDDVADLQCSAVTAAPASVVTRADITEASGSRTYPLAVESATAAVQV